MHQRRIEALKKKSRRLSVREGIFATAKGSFGDYYISPFAIAINTSNSLIAMFRAVAGLLGPFTQLFSSKLIGKYSRKEIIRKAVFFESLMWLPMILIALLFHFGIIQSALPLILISIFSIYIILSNIGSPAWFSWIGDLVDKNKRGRWFSQRNLIIGFVSIILALAASFFLDFFKSRRITLFGFMILFFLAFLSRLESWRIIKNQYEPKIKLKKGDYFSFWSFIKKAPKTNFGNFSIFRAVLAFAGSISSPLLAVYLLRNLGFGYKTYMIIILAGTVFSLLIIELWGKIADRFGNYFVLKITAIPIALVPILWILSPSPLYLATIPSIVSGVAWSGFGLSSGNFIYDNVRPQKRGLAVSYFNMLHGVGTFLGAGLGAILIKTIKPGFLEPIFIVFIISSIARFIAIFWGIFKVKEIRKTKKSPDRKTFNHIVLKEIRPTIHEEFHQIRSIKERIFEK